MNNGAHQKVSSSAIVPAGAFRFPLEKSFETKRFAFLLLPEFTLFAFSAALDTLRIANQIAQAPLFEWAVISENGAPTRSSSGVEVSADSPLTEIRSDSYFIVCSGNRHLQITSNEVLAAIRRHARFGGKLGGICTGASTIARAGLIGARRFTLHWENQPGFAETFPNLLPSRRRIEIDGDLITCAGGAAASELMLAIIMRDYGREFSVTVADMCLSCQSVEPRQTQRSSLSTAINARNSRLVSALREMYLHIEDPRGLADISRDIGLSRRQMERLFRRYLGESPAAVYRNIRLDRARTLLTETDLSVTDVDIICGFNGSGNFARRYKDRFGHSPSTRPTRLTTPESWNL